MDGLQSRYFGCLTGLAAGDAMGRPVEGKTLPQILQSYGPEGLQGLDLMNGAPQVGIYSQFAAFTANALLLSLIQGNSGGLTRWLTLALTQWLQSQQGIPGKCWVSRVAALTRRCPPEPELTDPIARRQFGSAQSPTGRLCRAEPLAAAIPAGLYYREGRLSPGDIGKLGAQSMALTQGAPMALLSGAMVSYLVAGLVQAPEVPMHRQVQEAAAVTAAQFSHLAEANQFRRLVLEVAHTARHPQLPHREFMEKLNCRHAHTVLLGGIYAALASGGNLDDALVMAVNHSGRSAAVASVTGALLGAAGGSDASFYLESLEAAGWMGQLAVDLACAGPKQLFDDDWERKYFHGEPVEATGWAEA